MAIIIPSNKIYNIQNKKIVENAISQIEVSQNNVELKNDSEKSENLSEIISASNLKITDSKSFSYFNCNPNPISENILFGKYVFKDNDEFGEYGGYDVSFNFESNGEYFNRIVRSDSKVYYYYSEPFRDENNTKIEYIQVRYTNAFAGNYGTINVNTPQKLYYTSGYASYGVNKDLIWQIATLSGFQVDISYKETNESLLLQRLKNQYYIYDIEPTIQVKFDVKISDIKASANYNITSPNDSYISFKNYNGSYKEITSRETYVEGYNYSEATYDYINYFQLGSSVYVKDEEIIVNFNINLDEETIVLQEHNLGKTDLTQNYPFKCVIEETTQNYYKLKIVIADNIIACWGQDISDGYYNASGNFGRPITAKKIELVAKEVKIIYNETNRYVSSSSETKTLSTENEGDKKISIRSNPFIRVQNEKSGVSLTDTIYNETLDLYQNGKEQATILCSIGEYFDENDNLAVSTANPNKMIFDIYDEVVPTYNTPFGDAPLSLAENGKPKLFKVLGSKAYFDGAVWQELTLQESGTSNAIISNGSKGLSYEEIDGKMYCTGIGTCNDKNIRISGLLNGKQVYAIKGNSFRTNQNLEKIIVENGINIVGSYAFAWCFNLKKVILPNSLTTIDVSAFQDCSSISSVKFGIGLNSIGKWAFENCTSLVSVTIPDSVTEIGNNAFYGCKSNKILHIGSGLRNIGSGVFSENISLESVTISNGMNYIGRSMFQGCGIVDIKIPNSVTQIDYFAFNDCKKLKSISLSNNIIKIDYSAFAGCDNISDIYFNGNQSQWNNIIIESGNDSLMNAAIHFNS
jgi:hypothetical protein